VITTNILIAQVDWSRWEKAEVDYPYTATEVGNNFYQKNSATILGTLKSGYAFFISDLDGDNCPFYPTCSSFFVESVSKTNILKGTLMFADRFTRDSNLFKSHEHYPTHISGRLYDPINNYLLEDSTIIYYSRNKLVE
jgi:putative component of membrane protein insertase Oxa1/YidC/SpoIIIJ protein YidD